MFVLLMFDYVGFCGVVLVVGDVVFSVSVVSVLMGVSNVRNLIV